MVIESFNYFSKCCSRVSLFKEYSPRGTDAGESFAVIVQLCKGHLKVAQKRLCMVEPRMTSWIRLQLNKMMISGDQQASQVLRERHGEEPMLSGTAKLPKRGAAQSFCKTNEQGTDRVNF
jgi:Zn-finger domain-containing protein